MRNLVRQIKAQVFLNFTGCGVKKVAMRYSKSFTDNVYFILFRLPDIPSACLWCIGPDNVCERNANILPKTKVHVKKVLRQLQKASMLIKTLIQTSSD